MWGRRPVGQIVRMSQHVWRQLTRRVRRTRWTDESSVLHCGYSFSLVSALKRSSIVSRRLMISTVPSGSDHTCGALPIEL